MTIRTKGDLCGLTVRPEQNYGKVSQASSSEYAGTLVTLSTPDEVGTEDIAQCGSQVRSDIIKVSQGSGYTARFTYKRGHNWQKWIDRVMGSLEGARSILPSFSTVFRVASDENHLLTGCKCGTFQMTAGNIGEHIEMTATAIARWHTVTPFTDSDGTPLDMAPVSIPLGVPITYNQFWEWSTDGINFTPIKGKGFALSIERSLQAEPGMSSDESDAFRLDAGEDSIPQDLKIRLDITVTSQGPEWDRLRLAFTKGVTVRTVIDGKTVTLKDCYLDPAMPDRSQATYDETVGWIASDLTVA